MTSGKPDLLHVSLALSVNLLGLVELLLLLRQPLALLAHERPQRVEAASCLRPELVPALSDLLRRLLHRLHCDLRLLACLLHNPLHRLLHGVFHHSHDSTLRVLRRHRGRDRGRLLLGFYESEEPRR